MKESKVIHDKNISQKKVAYLVEPPSFEAHVLPID